MEFLVAAAGLIAALAILSSCGLLGGAKVRYDAAPSPIGENFHTVLMETTCGGRTQLGYGQAGCSFAHDEEPGGELILHTPLPGSIRLLSRDCGIDKPVYHSDVEGSFRYTMKELFGQVPKSVTSCVVEVLVGWELVKGMTSEYPLDGMVGRFYYRRRQPGRSVAAMHWEPGPAVIGQMQGVGFGQFREVAPQRDVDPFPVSEPLQLVIKTSKPVTSGKYRLWGCQQGVQEASFNGDTIVIPRDVLVGPRPAKGSCVLFGYAIGSTSDGGSIHDDLVLGVEVFGYRVMRLAGSVTLSTDEVCYEAESAVSVAILNHGQTNDLSTKLTDCFPMPADRRARLGFFTHKGRSVYAVIEGDKLDYVQ